jgi:hypothetical protein
MSKLSLVNFELAHVFSSGKSVFCLKKADKTPRARFPPWEARPAAFFFSAVFTVYFSPRRAQQARLIFGTLIAN